MPATETLNQQAKQRIERDIANAQLAASAMQGVPEEGLRISTEEKDCKKRLEDLQMMMHELQAVERGRSVAREAQREATEPTR